MPKKKTVSKARRTLYKVVAVCIVFLLSLSFLAFRFFYQSIIAPFALASSTTSSVISKQDIHTLVLLSVSDLTSATFHVTNIDFIIFDKDNKKIVLYEIPSDFKVDVPGKFGQEDISKVLALGALNSAGNSLNLMRQTTSNLFGFPTHNYILVNENMYQSMYKLFTTGSKKGLLTFDNIRNANTSVKTDLYLGEFYALYDFINSLPDDRFILQKFDSRVESIDEDLRDLTFDSPLAAENKSIAILNGSGISGVATFGARVVENMGGRVIDISNANESYLQSVLVTDSLDAVTTVEIASFFGVEKIVLRESAVDISSNEPVINRTDLTLILGLDIAEKL